MRSAACAYLHTIIARIEFALTAMLSADIVLQAFAVDDIVIHRVKLRHEIFGHNTIAILWVQRDMMLSVKWRRFIVLFKSN